MLDSNSFGTELGRYHAVESSQAVEPDRFVVVLRKAPFRARIALAAQDAPAGTLNLEIVNSVGGGEIRYEFWVSD